ncbi:unnamed protein product [Symbiodinium sp. CCMP2592]|nr:unnamed protein product [Symbiodinium sp. CCMP2592]
MEAAQALLWGQRSLSERFGALQGRELQERVFQTYQVPECNEGLVSVPWFKNGSRNIVRHSINSRKQASVKALYMKGILTHGIMTGCRGEAWLVASEAFYDAVDQAPNNAQVLATLKFGLQARVLYADTPADVLTHDTEYLRDVNNRWHGGANISFHELVMGADDVDQARSGGNSNYHEEMMSWLASSEFKDTVALEIRTEKYSAQSFKTARALRNKLKSFGILKDWDEFFGSETDFLNENLTKHEHVMSNMNSFATLLDSRFSGQSNSDLGPVLLEACKFCVGVPLMQVQLGGKSRRHPPFIFVKGAESQMFQECQERLCCPVAGALFIRKLSTAGAAAQAAGNRKRALVPDLSPAVQKRAKAKAKGQPKSKGKAAKQVLAPGESAQTLEADVEFAPLANASEAEAPGHRQRLWLDDLIAALNRCSGAPFQAAYQKLMQTPGSSHLMGNLISYALEFCFVGKVVVGKKCMKDWSSLRPALQDILHAALRKANAELPAGDSMEEVLAKLVDELARSGKAPPTAEAATTETPLARNKTIIADKQKTAACKKFLTQNNDKNFLKHPALVSTMKHVREVHCQCPQPGQWDAPADGFCDLHDRKMHNTLSNLVWSVAKTLESEDLIPAAVSDVGNAALALTVFVDDAQRKATNQD